MVRNQPGSFNIRWYHNPERSLDDVFCGQSERGKIIDRIRIGEGE